MNRLRLIYLSSVSLAILLNLVASSGCRQQTDPAKKQSWQTRLQRPQLTPSAFTTIVAEAIVEAIPSAKVQVDGPLEIIINVEAGESECSLENAWRDCGDNVEIRRETVIRYVDTLRSMFARLSNNGPLDVQEIVPIIKSGKWVAEADRQGMNVYREELAADLFVIYAEDGPNQLRFVDKDEYLGFSLASIEMRAKAIANLRGRLPKVERYGEGPLYMLAAGGTFESSLLLFSDVWKDLDEAVDGRIVVAVPSRDLLMFTGENAHEAIQQMRGMVEEIHRNGDYLISKQLLLRNNDRWEKKRDENEVPKLHRKE